MAVISYGELPSTVAEAEALAQPGKGLTDYMELVFSIGFLLEAIIKLVALLPLAYFSVGWNCFDFLLCLFSIFDFVTEWALASDSTTLPFNPTILRLLRMARIARLVRLVRSAKGLRTLLATILQTLPALANVCSLLALLCLVFATMGMGFFGDVLAQPRLGYGGQWPSFRTFPGAMLLMVTMATSEQWPTIMRACTVSSPFCGIEAGEAEDGAGCGQHSVVAAIFFVLYQLVGSLLMMNLMVGVVVDQFTSTSIRENMRVPHTAILEFQEMWRKFDPDGSYYIPGSCLAPLITGMLPPLGVKEDPSNAEGQLSGKHRSQRLATLLRLEAAWLPVRDGKVHFQETLFALARCEAGCKLPDCTLRTALDKHARKQLDMRELRGVPVLWNAHEFFAAEIVQRLYRGFRQREEMYRKKQKQIKRERVDNAFRISSALLTSFVTSDVDACASTLAYEQYTSDDSMLTSFS